jgi:hypothetical protein
VQCSSDVANESPSDRRLGTRGRLSQLTLNPHLSQCRRCQARVRLSPVVFPHLLETATATRWRCCVPLSLADCLTDVWRSASYTNRRSGGARFYQRTNTLARQIGHTHKRIDCIIPAPISHHGICSQPSATGRKGKTLTNPPSRHLEPFGISRIVGNQETMRLLAKHIAITVIECSKGGARALVTHKRNGRSSMPRRGLMRRLVRWISVVVVCLALPELPLVCVAWRLTTRFLRSSGHFNTDPAPRTGLLVRRLRRT